MIAPSQIENLRVAVETLQLVLSGNIEGLNASTTALQELLLGIQEAIDTQQFETAKATAATISVSQVVTTTSQTIVAANPNRIGLIIYNNSSNSIYLSYGGTPASSSIRMTRILATFAQMVMEQPIYTGAIYGIRNSGTGTCLVTELTA
jgi:hypothetical protein